MRTWREVQSETSHCSKVLIRKHECMLTIEREVLCEVNSQAHRHAHFVRASRGKARQVVATPACFTTRCVHCMPPRSNETETRVREVVLPNSDASSTGRSIPRLFSGLGFIR